jgi:hypothetical protein
MVGETTSRPPDLDQPQPDFPREAAICRNLKTDFKCIAGHRNDASVPCGKTAHRSIRTRSAWIMSKCHCDYEMEIQESRHASHLCDGAIFA